MEVTGGLRAQADLSPGESGPRNNPTANLMGPRAGINLAEKRKGSFRCLESNPGRLA
jgi:hypothetical protein